MIIHNWKRIRVCDHAVVEARWYHEEVFNIYLVGFMGAGKTAVGRRLARRLGRELVDLDDEIAERAGMTIPEIFAHRGEAGFRRLESEQLERTAARSGLVVATGGGAFSSPANRGLIERTGGVSVFLDVPWSALVDRVDDAADGRPMWRDEPRARELYEARLADYRRASIRVGLDGAETVDEIARRIEAAVSEIACAS